MTAHVGYIGRRFNIILTRRSAYGIFQRAGKLLKPSASAHATFATTRPFLVGAEEKEKRQRGAGEEGAGETEGKIKLLSTRSDSFCRRAR